MAELFSETTPLAGIDRTGVNPADAGVEFKLHEQRAICQVFAAKGQSEKVAGSLGVSSAPGVATETTDFTCLPLSPGQWMLHSADGRDGTFCQGLNEKLKGAGYVSEQSHGRLIISVSGKHARPLLEKGCRLDLHPAITQAGYCAQTPIAQVGVLLHQKDDSPSYDLMLYSGFAQSFWHWLTDSAAQYGYRVVE